MYDVPPIGRRFKLRGARGVTLTLDEFAPTGIDAWNATADVDGRTFAAVVVRHDGDVMARGLALGGRVRAPAPPSPDAVLAVVVTRTGPSLAWLPAGDRSAYAEALSLQVDPGGGRP